jgi:hypothetical protein
MVDFVDAYFFGWLIACNLSAAWEMSSFRIHLFNTIYKVFRVERELYTDEDWELDVAENWGLFGEMLMCTFCYGTWLSLIVSSVYSYYFSCPMWLPVVCALSWPTMNYAALNYLKKKCLC